MALPEPYHDHYPYERYGVIFDTAETLRSQDKRITDLQHENKLLKDELYAVNTWRKKAQLILKANNIDVDTMWKTMEATQWIFK